LGRRGQVSAEVFYIRRGIYIQSARPRHGAACGLSGSYSSSGGGATCFTRLTRNNNHWRSSTLGLGWSGCTSWYSRSISNTCARS
jgi:hypothetical protein